MNSLKINELDNEQRRELINTQQRFSTWRDARERLDASRGSMVWHTVNGVEYLLRSYYEKAGTRKQRSLGVRSETTEALKADFERGRDEAKQRFATIDAAMDRQAAINRALRLGRVPMISARIMRALDRIGALGAGLRVVGTHALFAYEAVAGVMVDTELTTTGDIDLLFDSRGGLRFIVSDDVSERSLMAVLRNVDKSFEKSRQPYRAENAQGYMVDLIKPMRNPPWAPDASQSQQGEADDLTASEIEGLVWLENAPSFEAVALDERGYPLRIVATDPRVWTIHKHWISQRVDRDPLKKRRDAEQAQAVGAIVAEHFPHLPVQSDALRMLPKDVVADAAHLFQAQL
ncbi:GSU2403 family nucleotidyltransferase fold protein [Devosia sp. A369]